MINKENIVTFSKKEFLTMGDSDFLITKQVITKKFHKILQRTEEKLKPFVSSKEVKLPDSLLLRTGKISKGENYLNLPYQVLDYPRYFSSEAIFTYRTMFWWGNFVSCTLHLQGEIFDIFKNSLLLNLPRFHHNDIFFCVNDSPWEYHYERGNYIPLEEMSEAALMQHMDRRRFAKLSRKIPLEYSLQLPEFSLETFQLLYKILNEAQTLRTHN